MEDKAKPEGLTLGTALTVLRRHVALVLLCAVLVPASALAVSLAQEKRYTAAASLLFRDPAFDQKLFGSTFVEPGGDPAREAATNVRLVSLDVVAVRTARALPERVTPEEVSSKIEVAEEGQSDVVSVEATDPDPRFAALLANTFAEQYIAFRREADRAKIEESLVLIRRQLATLSPAARSGLRGASLQRRAEELQVLSSLQTGNAELVQRARVPDSPSSPKTQLNVAIGALVGLLLGVSLAFVRERLDHRMRDPREAEEIFGRPLLATIPHSRTLAQAGPAHETSLSASEGEAFRMLRANLRYFNVDHSVRSVLVTSAAPGDGKSTIAWNLARAAASAGSRVLLIEADLRHPSLASSAEHLQEAPGLSTVLAISANLEEVVQAVAVDQVADGLISGRTFDVLVAGPIPPNPVDLIESQRMRDLIRHAESTYELVVIDTPPTAVVSDAVPLLKEVSGVLVVTRLNKNTREAATRLRKQLENLDAPTLGIVVNGVRLDRTQKYGYGYGYGYGVRSRHGANGASRLNTDEPPVVGASSDANPLHGERGAAHRGPRRD